MRLFWWKQQDANKQESFWLAEKFMKIQNWKFVKLCGEQLIEGQLILNGFFVFFNSPKDERKISAPVDKGNYQLF